MLLSCLWKEFGAHFFSFHVDMLVPDSHQHAELPLELHTYILCFYDLGCDIGLKTLLSVLATNHYLRAAASAPIVWKPYYAARYMHGVPENEERRRAQYGDDYRQLYFARRELDRQALRILDEIRTNIAGRNAKACALAKVYSFDVWDALRLEDDLQIPAYFCRRKPTRPPAPHALPRQYWASIARGLISRHWAVQMWKRVASGDFFTTMEEMLSGFSAFFGLSPTEISGELDDETDDCRHFLQEKKVVHDQNQLDFDLRKVCAGIVEYMEDCEWMVDDHDPHLDEHLLNSFPHTFMQSSGIPLTVLSKTWLFIGIARRLGLDAFATRLPPRETICCVRSPREPEPIIVNFRKGAQLLVKGSEVPFYQTILAAGFPEGMAGCAFIPLPAIVFLVEAIENIGSDLRRYHDNEIGPWDNDDEERELLAAHAMQCAIAIGQAHNDDSPLIFPERMAELLPLDGEAVFMDALLGYEPETPQRAEFVREVKDTIQRIENVEARVKRRPRLPENDPKHFAGQIVYNPPMDEAGCIIDWQYDPEPAGSTSDIPEDGNASNIRYRILSMDLIEFVREPTDCEPWKLTRSAARNLYHSWKHFGRYFEDVSEEDMVPDDDDDGSGKMLPTKLVLTAEMQLLYPDDSCVRRPVAAASDDSTK
ncbi:hypothetical protein C8Q70DRAFT_1029509 [Cubamyces menziesii]|nr:hypothetical protein C8Q70DRAFT_1029509 [Cubamyces menziesii]